MRVLTWIFTAVLLGINLHALVALGAVLIGRATTAPQRRSWAIRCAASSIGFFVLSAVMCGVSISLAFSVDAIAPSEKATHVARGISEAMNCLAFGTVGSAFPFFAALALIVLARRAAPRE
jgi:hypothetical protein